MFVFGNAVLNTHVSKLVTICERHNGLEADIDQKANLGDVHRF